MGTSEGGEQTQLGTEPWLLYYRREMRVGVVGVRAEKLHDTPVRERAQEVGADRKRVGRRQASSRPAKSKRVIVS
jgi:hypothetical protein